jgi:hypothetical protein
MVLKKASAVSVLALAIGVSAVGSVSAAAVVKPSVVQVASSSYIINGVSESIHTFAQSGKTLASFRELSTKLGVYFQAGAKGVLTAKLNGHTVELQLNSKVIKVDGVEQQLSVPVKSVNGATYVELRAFVEALGGSFNSGTYIDANLLANVDHIQWVDASKFIASVETEEGRVDYMVDAKTGKHLEILNATDASELFVSPDGTQAAYSDSTGAVYVKDLNSGVSTKVSADPNVKPELVWSADSKSIFYLKTDKGTTISQLDLASGKVTDVQTGGDFKSNLNVTTDGKTLTYTQYTQPKIVDPVLNDGDTPNDDNVNIDPSTEMLSVYQYVIDPANTANKPVQLTTSKDDKMSFEVAADASNVYYVSIGDETTKSKLVAVSKDKTVKTVFDQYDVAQATMANGKLYVLTAGDANNQFVFEIDPATGTATKKYTVSADVTDIVAKAGSFAVISNGHVYVDVDGKWKPTTR